MIIALEKSFIFDIKDEIQKKPKEINYYLIPLFHPRFRHSQHDNDILIKRNGPITRSDRELEIKDWINNIIGKISDYIDLDCKDKDLQNQSYNILKNEMSWGCHLSLKTMIIPTPNLCSTNYARSLLQLSAVFQQIYVRIPLILPLSYQYQYDDSSEFCKDGWIVWDKFRQNLGDYNRCFVALELTHDAMGEENLSDEFILRWNAEPVKALILHTYLFITNIAGYPVLSKNMQHIVELLVLYSNLVIFTGTSNYMEGSYIPYIQYIQYLKLKNNKELSDAERHISGYEDTLQIPLQPLMDNLEAQTYETFEKDPTKYIKYEEAIEKALVKLYNIRLQRKNAIYNNNDNNNNGKDGSRSSPEEKVHTKNADMIDNIDTDTIELIVTVVGAGRGPLIARTISASFQTKIPVRIYAVEKNRNAIITLRNRIITENWTNVTVIASDIREWIPTEQSDLMISELLGSFGDNELSPECLDGAQKCLKLDGISIPYNYTSYITPIASAMIWNNAKHMNSSNSIISNGMDTAFVVKLFHHFRFASAKPLFKFEHPNHNKLIDNQRYEVVSFVSNVTMVMHGIAGYFESTLYCNQFYNQDNTTSNTNKSNTTSSNDNSNNNSTNNSTIIVDDKVMLSIVPESHTVGMCSWFPLFVPLSQPVRIIEGQTITIHIWRCVDVRKVWYEWCLSSPINTPIQNSNGKAFNVGLI